MDTLYVVSALLEPSATEIGEQSPVCLFNYDFATTPISKVYTDIAKIKKSLFDI